MKVISLVQFYLDYVLPRAEDWVNRGLEFEEERFRVIVRLRNPEEELFPNGIDKTLSSMELSLTRLNFPQGKRKLLVSDGCFDRIEVQVERNVPEIKSIQQEEVQSSFLQIAIKYGNRFLHHCRVVSKSPFVHGIKQHYRLEDQRFYILTPRTISWFDGESGKSLPVYEGVNATATSGAIQSPERGCVSIAQVIESLKVSVEPNLSYSFLVDSEEMLRTGRLREAVVSMAISCEVAVHEFIRRKGKFNDPEVKRIAKSRLSFADKYLDSICNFIAGRSLKIDDIETFKKMRNVYRVRNNIVHEGRSYYSDGKIDIIVNEKLGSEFLRATRSTVNWLKQL